MKELEIKYMDPVVELIDKHSDALTDKKLIIEDLSEFDRYIKRPLYSKYTGGNEVGYELTTKDGKYRMIVTRNTDPSGYVHGYKVEKVEKILRYSMKMYSNIGAKTGEYIKPSKKGNSTIADYINADKESASHLYMVDDNELQNEWTKLDKNKYRECKNKDIKMTVQPIMNDSNTHIVKEISKDLVIVNDLYTFSRKIDYPQTIIFKHLTNENIRTI